MEWKTTKGMEDNEKEWKTMRWNGRQDMLGAQRIYLQQQVDTIIGEMK
jgi:hypothetical protein